MMFHASLFTLTLVFLAAPFAHILQPHARIRDQFPRSILDETYIDTPGTPQNLCGYSTFKAVDHSGPSRDDCVYLMNTAKRSPDGFWMVSRFGGDGTAWVEFSRLQTCGIKVRRTDEQGGDVPFGDEDAVDLVNSVLTEFPEGKYLPTVQGQMTCSRGGSSAAVEWQIFRV